MFALKLDRVLVLPVVRDAQEGSLKLTQSFLRIASGKAYCTRRGQHEDNVGLGLGLGKSCQLGLGLARDLISRLYPVKPLGARAILTGWRGGSVNDEFLIHLIH